MQADYTLRSATLDDVSALVQHRRWMWEDIAEIEGHTFTEAGLAGRIFQAAMSYCEANSIKRLLLHASHYGRRLYEGLGFQHDNEMRMDFE
jgi:hypothetical protein